MKSLSACILAFVLVLTWVGAASALTTGDVTGHVKDAAGRPIADVKISIASGSYATAAVSDAKGFYAFVGLPSDTYTLSFSKTGYEPL
ncbi:MAG TPA: carboxypeptidase-like regulatory domain-containing protein, partial [Candidatus Baltobacteraceae bacterium]